MGGMTMFGKGAAATHDLEKLSALKKPYDTYIQRDLDLIKKLLDTMVEKASTTKRQDESALQQRMQGERLLELESENRRLKSELSEAQHWISEATVKLKGNK